MLQCMPFEQLISYIYTDLRVSFDVKHMPIGCGTWPAIWETMEAGWPNAVRLYSALPVNNV